MKQIQKQLSAILNFLFNPKSKTVYSWWVIIGTYILLFFALCATGYRILQ
ncbi:MAG: hypothetical protein V9E96_08415 [Chitinophagaceae bacterium]